MYNKKYISIVLPARQDRLWRTSVDKIQTVDVTTHKSSTWRQKQLRLQLNVRSSRWHGNFPTARRLVLSAPICWTRQTKVDAISLKNLTLRSSVPCGIRDKNGALKGCWKSLTDRDNSEHNKRHKNWFEQTHIIIRKGSPNTKNNGTGYT